MPVDLNLDVVYVCCDAPCLWLFRDLPVVVRFSCGLSE